MAETASETGKKIITGSARNVSLSVAASRILGLFREMLTSSVIGGGLFMSAWVLALTIPSLFRKILGEGALGAALVPVLVHTMEQEGRKRTGEKFSTILLWLTMLMGAITILVALPAVLLLHFEVFSAERLKLVVALTPIVMPYSIMICAVGIMSSCANTVRCYFLPTLTAILQNAVMIGALFFMMLAVQDSADRLKVLGFSVLLAGAAEFLFMLAVLKKCGIKVRFSRKILGDFGSVKEVMKVALPGMLGAGALQVSLIVDRTVAGWLGDYAPSALYFSERLVTLPIGVFAFAFGTVSVAEMARSAEKQKDSFIPMMMYSLRNLLFVTVPIMVFMRLFGGELMRLFFVRGAFSERAFQETMQAMNWYVLGIPFFAAAKVTVAGFNARRDMKTPFCVSLFCIALNIMLNLLLMKSMRQGGVALATVVSSVLNNGILILILVRLFGRKNFGFGSFSLYLLKMIVVCALSGWVACRTAEWGSRFWMSMGSPAGTTGGLLFRLGAGGIGFGVVFLPSALLVRLDEAKEFIRRYIRFR